MQNVVMKRMLARAGDIDNLELMIREEQFDWQERYNHKYILNTAEEWGLNKSRFQKAVETLDLEQRLIRNKIQRSKENKKKKG